MLEKTTLIQASPQDIAQAVAKEIERMGLKSDPVWLTSTELAERLKVSKQHIERIAFHKQIPFIDISIPGSSKRMLRFSLSAVEQKMWESE